jgi:hypothetical protein
VVMDDVTTHQHPALYVASTPRVPTIVIQLVRNKSGPEVCCQVIETRSNCVATAQVDR